MRDSLNFPSKESILHGHTTPENAYIVKDYPYGFRLRCQMKCFVESKKGKGCRYVTITSNPKKNNETWNAPKASTYSQFIFMYLNDEGHVKTYHLEGYHEKDFSDQMTFLVDVIGVENIPQSAQDAIREWYKANTAINFGYRVADYSEPMQPLFKQWTRDTMLHIAKCDFKDLLNHPCRPQEDATRDEKSTHRAYLGNLPAPMLEVLEVASPQ